MLLFNIESNKVCVFKLHFLDCALYKLFIQYVCICMYQYWPSSDSGILVDNSIMLLGICYII